MSAPQFNKQIFTVGTMAAAFWVFMACMTPEESFECLLMAAIMCAISAEEVVVYVKKLKKFNETLLKPATRD